MAQDGTISAWRAWRLRIDHPGVWMIHCHLLTHMVWGMQTVSSHLFVNKFVFLNEKFLIHSLITGLGYGEPD
jgi:hypothetical protein